MCRIALFGTYAMLPCLDICIHWVTLFCRYSYYLVLVDLLLYIFAGLVMFCFGRPAVVLHYFIALFGGSVVLPYLDRHIVSPCFI